jgi:SAM-dependent methyltransferase
MPAAILPPRPLRRAARRAMLAAQPALRRSGVSIRVGRALERRRAAVDVGPEPAVGPDGLPIPPAALRVGNVNNADLDFFFHHGAATAAALAAAAERNGQPLTEVGRLLDFGCGCGRVLRQWGAYPGLEAWGSDLNPAMVAWVDAHLPFARAQVNGLEPPLDHADETFDLLYAISVFTHLPGVIGVEWLAELRRVLRPGGLALITVNGASCLPYLTRRERATFERGELVVQFAEAAGENICAAYHPPAYMRALAGGSFDVLEFQTPEEHGFMPQDLWVLRRPSED